MAIKNQLRQNPLKILNLLFNWRLLFDVSKKSFFSLKTDVLVQVENLHPYISVEYHSL